MRESDQILNVLSDDDPNMISMRQTMMALLRRLGGPEGLADIIADDFAAAEPGSPQRIQLGGKILQALQTFGVDDAPESASEDELMAQVRNIVANDPSLITAGQGDDNDN